MSEIQESEPCAMEKKQEESEEKLGGPKFYPCLYIQRYHYVKEELAKFNIKSLVDFGSAECKISRFLVQLPTLQQLSLVDLDGDLLESNKYQIRPLTFEYLHRRDVALDVGLYEGDMTRPDERLRGTEAVSMVEIIEHLHPPVLEAAVVAVFGQIRPLVAVVTTPNSDYNQLFPNFSGFRHWDHKFEWSQAEFKQWCGDVCSCYGYKVTYGGVGEPPPGSEHLGYCSQAATFTLLSDRVPVQTDAFSNSYRLILACTYPCKLQSSMSEDEQVLEEIAYRVRQFTVWCQRQLECMCDDSSQVTGQELCYVCRCAKYRLDETECPVPVSYLMVPKEINSKFDTGQLRSFLQNYGYRLTEDQQYVVVEYENYDNENHYGDGDVCADDGRENLVITDNKETGERSADGCVHSDDKHEACSCTDGHISNCVKTSSHIKGEKETKVCQHGDTIDCASGATNEDSCTRCKANEPVHFEIPCTEVWN